MFELVAHSQQFFSRTEEWLKAGAHGRAFAHTIPGTGHHATRLQIGCLSVTNRSSSVVPHTFFLMLPI